MSLLGAEIHRTPTVTAPLSNIDCRTHQRLICVGSNTKTTAKIWICQRWSRTSRVVPEIVHMVDMVCFLLWLHDGKSGLRQKVGSILNLFTTVRAWRLLSVVGSNLAQRGFPLLWIDWHRSLYFVSLPIYVYLCFIVMCRILRRPNIHL